MHLYKRDVFVYIVTPSGQVLTFKLLSSFPARANSKVDLPQPGGPKSKVILQCGTNQFVWSVQTKHMKEMNSKKSIEMCPTERDTHLKSTLISTNFFFSV